MKGKADQGYDDGKTAAKKIGGYFDENPTTPVAIGIKDVYYKMHTNQTVQFVKEQHEKWRRFDHAEMTIMEALDLLASYVDASDKDAQFANSIHAYQTAEAIREQYPEHDWLQLTGLIHDVGKVMTHFGQPQWCTSGNTWPVGMAPRDVIAFGTKSFKDNPDLQDSRYNTRYGMYQEKCGLDNLLMSWGHDEYMYWVLKNHPTCTLPEEGLWCIRYHSFFPLHRDNEYTDMLLDTDAEKVKMVAKFSPFDSYSKTENFPDIEELKPYYQSLIDKYIPGKIKF